MVQLSLLGLLSQLDLLSPHQSLQLPLYFHSVLVDLVTLAHLEVLSLQFLLVVLSTLVAPAVLLDPLRLLVQRVLEFPPRLEVLSGPSPPSDLETLSVLVGQSGLVDRLDQ